MTGLTVGSLCSGIGGLDLGLERAGMTIRWQAEVDPHCARVLAKHWSNTPNHGDITTTDWSNVEPVDLLCAGYPCQPFSHAGRRLGTADDRHLWPHVAEAIRNLEPRWVLLENVTGHLGIGFDTVLSDLAQLGFDAEWSVVSACSVGASHMRRRLFAVAYPTGQRPPLRLAATQGRPGSPWGVEPERLGRPLRWSLGAAQPAVGREAHGLPGRVDRVRALGNAVVPQVGELVGRLIVTADNDSADGSHDDPLRLP